MEGPGWGCLQSSAPLPTLRPVLSPPQASRVASNLTSGPAAWPSTSGDSPDTWRWAREGPRPSGKGRGGREAGRTLFLGGCCLGASRGQQTGLSQPLQPDCKSSRRGPAPGGSRDHTAFHSHAHPDPSANREPSFSRWAGLARPPPARLRGNRARSSVNFIDRFRLPPDWTLWPRGFPGKGWRWGTDPEGSAAPGRSGSRRPGAEGRMGRATR